MCHKQTTKTRKLNKREPGKYITGKGRESRLSALGRGSIMGVERWEVRGRAEKHLPGAVGWVKLNCCDKSWHRVRLVLE